MNQQLSHALKLQWFLRRERDPSGLAHHGKLHEGDGLKWAWGNREVMPTGLWAKVD